MSNTDLIKELRALTQAGMKDCKDALEEANWDLQGAIDIVKTKGLNIVSGREGRVAAEGRVAIATIDNRLSAMVEVNCQTDFVANSPAFEDFADDVADKLYKAASTNTEFKVSDVEDGRKEIVYSTKENVVVRRWWAEIANDKSVMVFSYLHSNNKVGVLLTMSANSELSANTAQFSSLGDDLAMQVAAMSPLAVEPDRLDPEEVVRQKAIFEAQLKEMNKPEAQVVKIIEGKMNKWYKEVCLLEQESVIVPKTTVKQVIKNVAAQLGGDITVVNFVRCQVGEGIEKKQDNLADEVAKMVQG